MNLFLISIIITIIASVFYHICQKEIPSNVNPIISLMVTYIVALFLTIILYLFYPSKQGFWQSLKEVNWASYVLAISVIGLELGFLLAYRAGWKISIVGIVVNVIATLVLVIVGFYYYKESLTVMNSAGIILSLIGLTLLSLK